MEHDANTVGKQQCDNCLNCGEILTGKYCSKCGQESKTYRITVGRLALEFFKEAIDLDSRFFKSIKPLFLELGKLTQYFLAGKRRSFISPIQLYVFSSFLFFFTLNLPGIQNNKINFGSEDKTDSVQNAAQSTLNKSVLQEQKKIGKDNLGMEVNFGDFDVDTEAEYDSLQRSLDGAQRDSWFKQVLKKRALRLQENSKKDKIAYARLVSENFGKNLPTVVFLLIPLLALLLKILYRKSNYFYVEHLIFSVHIYSFAFLACSVAFILEWIGIQSSLLDLFPYIIIVVYSFIALRRVYGNGILKTTFKLLLLLFSFGTCLTVGLVINVFIVFLML
jgi:hypothetical protein